MSRATAPLLTSILLSLQVSTEVESACMSSFHPCKQESFQDVPIQNERERVGRRRPGAWRGGAPDQIISLGGVAFLSDPEHRFHPRLLFPSLAFLASWLLHRLFFLQVLSLYFLIGDFLGPEKVRGRRRRATAIWGPEGFIIRSSDKIAPCEAWIR